MRRHGSLVALLVMVCAVAAQSTHTVQAQGQRDTLAVSGFKQPVEVIRDRWGLNHIYAQNEDD
ncbi:MAG: hypothetical protein ABI880_13040, partial [Acidobacteriota bacterium]